jgi:hypothetical protein
MPDQRSPFIAQLERYPWVKVYVSALRADPCSYCGGRENMEVDHIVSQHDLGRSVPSKKHQNGFNLPSGDLDNVTAACHTCNRRKVTASLLDFLLELEDDDHLASGSRRWRSAQPAARVTEAGRVDIPSWEPDKTLAVAQALANQLGDAGILVARLIWQARVDAGWRPISRPRS